MKTTVRRGIAAVVLAGAATIAVAVPATAATTATTTADGGVTVVGQPDTSNLNDVWTFAPLGVPVFGLVQSVVEAPGKLY
ncbi:MAG TPA: hypothetical protein VG317_17175 [Pseudonocardiaceae bacterium]|jgi:hypothetical protein|nr:hypothetical protein [Pseudonocardiaceae bacterium]